MGATGSIGRQSLDIIKKSKGKFTAQVLTAGSNADALIALAIEHKPKLAVIADPARYADLKQALSPYGIEVAAGPQALVEAASRPDIDTVLTATVGYSGLAPTISAIKAGKDIALANKETLVVAGALITKLLASSNSQVYPVDSEHSAIYQCLQGEKKSDVSRLIITASGGPFRQWTREQMEKATVEDALHHPNWNMGAKITIDSATMLNKAFEIIEARWLFGMQASQITALVHPQSIIHSMVEFRDGAIKAQLGVPDMRLPIAYALGEKAREDYDLPKLTLPMLAELTFTEPDPKKFPCLALAYRALEQGGNIACIVNAANEIAVAAFLKKQIAFMQIYELIEQTLARVPFIADPSYDDFVATNTLARDTAQSLINKI